jgi:hypothetical protein
VPSLLLILYIYYPLNGGFWPNSLEGKKHRQGGRAAKQGYLLISVEGVFLRYDVDVTWVTHDVVGWGHIIFAKPLVCRLYCSYYIYILSSQWGHSAQQLGGKKHRQGGRAGETGISPYIRRGSVFEMMSTRLGKHMMLLDGDI